jgi:hypothetical protein
MAETTGIAFVDRKALYEEVWSTPGRTLAKKYGVSDVALAKACRRHKIPRPPRGHWAKLAAGKPSAQEPLPALDDPQLQEVRFYGGSARQGQSPTPTAGVTCEMEQRKAAIVVPERLTSPNALVIEIQDHLKARQTEAFMAGPNRRRIPAVSVTGASLPRALRILDTLFKAWESLGGQVSVKHDWFEDNKDAVYFSMDEDYATMMLDEKRVSLPGKEPHAWRREWTYTGELVLHLTHSRGGPPLRATWGDGKRQKLENILDSVVAVLLRQIDQQRLDRLNSGIRSHQRGRITARQAAKDKRDAEEKQRREDLRLQLDQWEYANRIREYLAVIEDGLANGKLRVRDDQAFAKWHRWACWYADEVDPLINAKPLPEEASPPVNTPMAELEFTSCTAPVVARLNATDADTLYRLSRDMVEAAEGRDHHVAWGEICDVLDGLGYDVSGRRQR